MGLYIYEAEYGNYPSQQGCAFWEALRTLPTPEKSVLGTRHHKIYVCPHLKGKTTPGLGICHYRGPNYTVTDQTPEDTPLGSDMLDNHPNGTINVLYVNGKIKEVKPNTPEWTKAEKYLSK